MRTQYEEADVRRLVEQLAGQVAAAFPKDRPLNIVGIRTRGEVLAVRLTELLAARHDFQQIGRGVLDITLYRDDLSEIGPRPLVRPTQLAIQVDGIPLLLVDDVLFTGRSVRAALDALSDFGRPSVIRLAVLVDRDGRELPIQPDFAALKLATIPRDHRVNVRFKETDGADEIVVERKG
jgi:pyrimidine operon attenuation protein / uracil phosphoribosyltransferase